MNARLGEPLKRVFKKRKIYAPCLISHPIFPEFYLFDLCRNRLKGTANGIAAPLDINDSHHRYLIH